jgi:hypothetical protein
MKTILFVLGALIVLSKLNQNQPSALTITVASPAAPPYGGAASNIAPVNDPYANLQNSGEGGVGPGTPITNSNSGSNSSGSTAFRTHYGFPITRGGPLVTGPYRLA